jgi:hypothetical protein
MNKWRLFTFKREFLKISIDNIVFKHLVALISSSQLTYFLLLHFHNMFRPYMAIIRCSLQIQKDSTELCLGKETTAPKENIKNFN